MQRKQTETTPLMDSLTKNNDVSSTALLTIELMKKFNSKEELREFLLFPDLIEDIRKKIVFLLPARDFISFSLTSANNYAFSMRLKSELKTFFPENYYGLEIYQLEMKTNHLKAELISVKDELTSEEKNKYYEICFFDVDISSIKSLFCYTFSSMFISIGCGICTFFSASYAAAAAPVTIKICIGGSGACIGGTSTVTSLGCFFGQLSALSKAGEKQSNQNTLMKKRRDIEANITKINNQIEKADEKINALKFK